MKQISDYNFSYSRVPSDRDPKPDQDYTVLTDMDDLKKGEVVKFIGFDDVDNHYGICVFIDSSGTILEVTGDFCNGQLFEKLRNALSRIQST